MTDDEAQSQVERPPDPVRCLVCGGDFIDARTMIHHQGADHSFDEVRVAWQRRTAERLAAPV